jgi:hypothetical protein
LALAQRRIAELKAKLALKRKKSVRPSGSTAAGVGVSAGRQKGVGSGTARGRRPAKPSDAKAVRVKKTAKKTAKKDRKG